MLTVFFSKSNLCGKLFLLLTLIGGMLGSAGQLPAQSRISPESDTLKVLSWNIAMLPRFVSRVHKSKRARVIGEMLAKSDYQVLVFQEAFFGRARRILRKELGATYPYEAGPANRGNMSFKTNSGIWILSKLPMEDLGTVQYSQVATADDKLARKGALLVEFDWKGQAVQVAGTHLNAGGPDSVRRSQMSELAALCRTHARKDVPQLICGDFNTEKGSERYEWGLGVMEVVDGPLMGPRKFSIDPEHNDLKERSNKPGKIIDFIFLKSNGLTPSWLERHSPILETDWHPDHRSLSDHQPLDVWIRF